MSKVTTIRETETEGVGKKMLVRHPSGAYELLCAWNGGGRIYLTPEEMAVFGAAMVVEAGIQRLKA